MSTELASNERLLDAQEIEKLLSQEGLINRPSVKAHLEALAQKIRRDSSALKRLEESQVKTKRKQQEQKQVPVPLEEKQEPEDPTSSAVVPKVPDTDTKSAATAPITVPSDVIKYKSIDKFSFDAGSYNSPTVTIYILMNSIGSIPDPKSQINCSFTPTSFDITIQQFNGINYRLLKESLANEIDPEKSKYILKANKILIKLYKKKTDYGTYDSWNELTSKKSKKDQDRSKKDPTAGIMDLMKDMYDKGDDKMKKMIGETMMKQREGKLNDHDNETGTGTGFGSGMGGMGM
jgi:calcyclin binding protein